MKITDIRTYVVNCYRTNFLFVKVMTDEGIHGVGEGTLEYKEQALTGAINDIKQVLTGMNPLRIEEIIHLLYRDSYWRISAVLQSAISAVEQALWDIAGKYHQMPVMDFFGGPVRDSIPMYANGWFAGAKTADEFAKKAKQTVALGIKALKWDPFGKSYMNLERQAFHEAIDCVAAVRGAVGKDIELLIEAHGRFNISTAIQVAQALAPFEPMFMEEPVPPDNLDALAEVHRKSPIPIASGERIFSTYAFREFLQKGCADIAQPDVSHCGGMMAIKKMEAMAATYYVDMAPHNPSGPVANAATLQLAGNLNNFRILEIMITDVSWRKDLTDEEVVFEGGCIQIPRKPGLGITLREEECLKHPFVPTMLRHYKGTLTDIRPPENTEFYFKGL